MESVSLSLKKSTMVWNDGFGQNCDPCYLYLVGISSPELRESSVTPTLSTLYRNKGDNGSNSSTLWDTCPVSTNYPDTRDFFTTSESRDSRSLV